MSGSCPTTVVKSVGRRLPKFSRVLSLMLRKGSFDFIGLNYYTARYEIDMPCQLTWQVQLFRELILVKEICSRTIYKL